MSNGRGATENLTIVDGQLDWSSGVLSNLVSTMASPLNPNGTPRTGLQWLVNGTVRNGGIRPRAGWTGLGQLTAYPGLFQGGFMYEPLYGYPYLVLLMGGVLYAIYDLDHPVLTDLTGGNPALLMPATVPQAFFAQGEDFLVIQAGDYLTGPFNVLTNSAGVALAQASSTLPLIWDGTTLRRSLGIMGSGHIPAGTPPLNEIPAAGPMCYYMQRLWFAQGRTYAAGDIVNSKASGSSIYGFRDSVLKVTECGVVVGGTSGDAFAIPTNAGNITALNFAGTLNTQLGQGVLYVMTRKMIYGMQVPVNRTDWLGTNLSSMPLQYAVAIGTGSVNDRSVVHANGDLYFQTLQPSIQTLAAAVRNFQQWANTPISVNEQRLLGFNDRSLMWAASGIYHDNRVLQTAMPQQTDWGVVHRSLAPINFDSISTLNNQLPPAWEGQLVGLDHLQLFVGDFGGRDRAFSLVLGQTLADLQLWELTTGAHTENGDNRIKWLIEFPAFTHQMETKLKELMTLELWLDDVEGTVDFELDYRPDSDTCFYPWFKWQVCAARDSNELPNPITPYPTKYGPGYVSTATLPHPPPKCASFTGRPAYMAYQFQPRLFIHGWCRVRAIFLHAAERERPLYSRMVCGTELVNLPLHPSPANQPPPVPPPPTPPPVPPPPPSRGLRGAFNDLMQDAGGEQIYGAAND